MAEQINAVTDLNTVEISLVRSGANRKQFAFFKSEGEQMDETAMEFLETLLSVESEGEKKLEEIFKQELDEKGKNAVIAAMRMLAGVKDQLPKDIMGKLAALGGYPMPTEKREDKDDKYPPPLSKQEEEEKKKEEEERMAKQKEDEKAAEEMAKVGDVPMKKDGTPDLASIPEAVRPIVQALWKQNADNEVLLKKERDLRVKKEMITKASEQYPNLGVADELGGILKSLHDLDPGVAKKVEVVLKSANEQIKTGLLFASAGTGRVPEAGSAGAKLEEMAKSYIQKSSDDKLTFEQAYAKVIETDEGRSLYREYNAEKDARIH